MDSRSARTAERGFTLLELVIAVAVFALVAALAQAGLSAVVRATESNRRASESQRETDLMLLRIDRELAQILARPVRGAYGDERPAVVGTTDRIEFSTLGFHRGARVAPVRRGIELRGKQLVLWQQAQLDAGPGTARRATVLAEPVQQLRFRYLTADESASIWPPRGPAGLEQLPRAIQIELEIPGRGTIERVIELAENRR